MIMQKTLFKSEIKISKKDWVNIFANKIVENNWSNLECRLLVIKNKDLLHFFKKSQNLLPTPQVMDIRNDVRKPEERSEKANKGGCSNLREWAANGLLPTPRKSGYESYETRSKRQGHEKAMSYLDANIQFQLNKKFQISQNFVAEMMGFPANWTILPFKKL